jgi:hypothetical protein
MAGPSYPAIPLSGPYAYNQQFAAVIPMLTIVCRKCGFTIFHNINALGV